MRIALGILLLLGGVGFATYGYYDLEQWRLSPPQRLTERWAQSVVREENRNAKLKTALMLIKDWKVIAPEPYFLDLIQAATPPFRKTPRGAYRMEIELIPWVEEMTYGFIIQHGLIDSQGNLTHEFSINVEVGKVW